MSAVENLMSMNPQTEQDLHRLESMGFRRVPGSNMVEGAGLLVRPRVS